MAGLNFPQPDTNTDSTLRCACPPPDQQLKQSLADGVLLVCCLLEQRGCLVRCLRDTIISYLHACTLAQQALAGPGGRSRAITLRRPGGRVGGREGGREGESEGSSGRNVEQYLPSVAERERWAAMGGAPLRQHLFAPWLLTLTHPVPGLQRWMSTWWGGWCWPTFPRPALCP